jgi:protein-L-isoaspartate(D-aspartate) O-methyltransferase
MDFTSARLTMVESQLRPNGVTDPSLILAMSEVPRELFLPAEQRALAYVDGDIELGKDLPTGLRFLLSPLTFGRMVQILMLQGEDRVLDVGCGSGYSCAILSRLARMVVTLESDTVLAAQAESLLASLQIRNAKLILANLPGGNPAGGPYDAILVNGRIEGPPFGLLGQLKDRGRLAAVVGDQDLARIALFTRHEAFGVRYVFDAAAPAVPGFAAERPGFVF